MNILNNINEALPAYTFEPVTEVQYKEKEKPLEYKPDIVDFISKKVVNKDDIKDTVTMPRAIFKGYLCFTAGTAINAIAGMVKKFGALSKTLGIIGSIISIYGTYNFVKPFLLKENDLTKEEK